MAFSIKTGDRRPLFVVVLKDNYGEEDEAVVDLNTATGTVFNMRLVGGGTIVNRGSAAFNPAVYPAAGAGEVTYSWGTADTATAGDYLAEVEVTWNDGKRETFPNDGYWDVTITGDIGTNP